MNFSFTRSLSKTDWVDASGDVDDGGEEAGLAFFGFDFDNVPSQMRGVAMSNVKLKYEIGLFVIDRVAIMVQIYSILSHLTFSLKSGPQKFKKAKTIKKPENGKHLL